MHTYEQAVRRDAYDLSIESSELVEKHWCAGAWVQLLLDRVALLEQWAADTPRYRR